MATELGIPAAIVACVYLFAALSNAARLFERAPSAFSFFALVFLIGFAVMGFTEAHLLQIHWVFWILFVALTVAVRRELEECGDVAPVSGGRSAIDEPHESHRRRPLHAGRPDRETAQLCIW